MTILFTSLLGLWVGSGVAFQAQSPGTRVIASTANWSITEQQFQQFLDLLPDETHGYFAAHPREFLDQLVQLWVMAAEARSQGLDKTPTFKATIDFYSNNMLAGELHKQQVTGNVTASDEAVQAFYEANKTDFTQIRLSHILILNADSPAVIEAKVQGGLPAAEARKKIEEVQAKMREGASFADLAKEYSQDSGTAPKGGDAGYISKGQLAPELDKAAFALKEGSYSGIVESPFGFHILHVPEVKVAPLADVSAEIRQRLDTDQFNARVKEKITQAGVKIDESFFQK
jgi:parvulin-like peptidyl-prolyl isomerase